MNVYNSLIKVREIKDQKKRKTAEEAALSSGQFGTKKYSHLI